MKYIQLLLVLVLTACSGNSNSNEETPEVVNFDVNALLEDAVNSDIIPAVNTFITEATNLEEQVSIFVANVSEDNLIKAQDQWKVTALAYADIHAFNIGEIRDKFLNLAIYNWPTLPSAIENIIRDNDVVDEALLSNFSSQVKNLSAIEYLLFGEENSLLINNFRASEKRRNFVSLSAINTKSQAERLISIWENPTNYSETFLTNEGTGIRGSFNLFYNGLHNLIDTGKVTKIGKPAGLENSSNTDPETTQAFYSHTSLAILKRNILSVKNVYFKNNGLGISNYVYAITRNNDINNGITTKIDEVILAIDAIPTNLFEAITTNHNEVTTLHKKLDELVVLFSVDVRSVLSITITSTDNDGD